jgi:hypothetical protein
MIAIMAQADRRIHFPFLVGIVFMRTSFKVLLLQGDIVAGTKLPKKPCTPKEAAQAACIAAGRPLLFFT